MRPPFLDLYRKRKANISYLLAAKELQLFNKMNRNKICAEIGRLHNNLTLSNYGVKLAVESADQNRREVGTESVLW